MIQHNNKEDILQKKRNRKQSLLTKTIGTLLAIFIVVLNQLGILKLPGGSSTGNRQPIDEVRILNKLQSQSLSYTEHARCRMNCRHISKNEIKDILQKGKINHAKSQPQDRPCPSYAVEGYTKDRQEVRIVFADCGLSTKVITAIDLQKEYQCHCK